MDETYNIKAIILNRKSFSEHDSRVIVYCRESGKLELTARGTKKIRSKLAGHLEPISLVDIMVVRGQKHDYIGTAISEKCYGNIKNDLEKLVPAGRAIKIVDQLIKPGVAEEEIFELLKDYLGMLDTEKKDFSAQGGSASGGEIFSWFFIFKLLAKLGHKPELSFCTSCASKIQPGKNRFDLARGGLVCGKCLDLKNIHQLAISDDSIKSLRLAIKYDFKQLKKIKIDKRTGQEIGEIVSSFFKYNFN